MKNMKINTTIIHILKWWPVVGLMMLISSLPFGWSLYQCISLCVLGSGYVLEYIVCKEWKQITWNHSKWIYVVMLALFVLPYVRQLFDPVSPTDYFWHQMRLHEWLGVIGVVGLLGFSEKLKMQHVAFTMLTTSVIMAVYCAYLTCGNDCVDWMCALRQYDNLRSHHINSHMVMNLYINTSIVFGLWWLHQPSKWWVKLLIILAIPLALSVIVLSDGRTGQATVLLIIYAFILYHIQGRNIGWYVLASIIIGFSAWGMIHFNDRFDKEKIDKDPRFAVWDYSMRQISQEPVCGYGYSSLDSTYLQGFYTDSVTYSDYTRRVLWNPEFAVQGQSLLTHHPHNAFMLYWLAMGLAGLVGLILLFGSAVSLPVKREDLFYLYLFVVAWFIQSMMEPIGDHLRPQFICLMLFVLQRTLCVRERISDKE